MTIPSIEKFRNSNVDSVQLVQVVEVKSIFGDGTNEEGHSPIRQITQYFSMDGELLAIRDTYKEQS